MSMDNLNFKNPVSEMLILSTGGKHKRNDGLISFLKHTTLQLNIVDNYPYLGQTITYIKQVPIVPIPFILGQEMG